MSAVVYVRFRCKLSGDHPIGIPVKSANERKLGSIGAHGWDLAKSDGLPIQQACTSLTLTLNGSSQSYRPSECLRDFLVSQVHKDALARLGNGVYSFSDHGFGVTVGGGQSDAVTDNATSGAWLDDPQYAYQKAELLQEVRSAGSSTKGGTQNYDMTRVQGDQANDIWVTFVEPVVVGCLGPWSLLKRGVELSSSSPLASFSPLVPFVNAMQLTFQFD